MLDREGSIESIIIHDIVWLGDRIEVIDFFTIQYKEINNLRISFQKI